MGGDNAVNVKSVRAEPMYSHGCRVAPVQPARAELDGLLSSCGESAPPELATARVVPRVRPSGEGGGGLRRRRNASSAGFQSTLGTANGANANALKAHSGGSGASSLVRPS
jgi:hypothetical protein